VQFTPTEPGQRWFPLLVTDSNSNQYSFGLEGTGVGSALAFTPGIIGTLAGNGTSGYSGNGGPATSAELYYPFSAAVDSTGNLYIADTYNNVIRKVDVSSSATTAITTAGLTVGTVTSASSNSVPLGEVISQSPLAGTRESVETAVSLVISSGPVQYLLTTAAHPASGGTVSPASGDYVADSVVPLTATPSAGYVFSSWTGPVANAASASTTVTMNAAESVTANFISALSVTPSSLHFGTLYLGQAGVQFVTLTNLGTTPLTITSVQITAPGNALGDYGEVRP
jgi:hypothetical protein